MRALTIIWRDPALRLIALAIMGFGSFVASVGPYQSVVAVQVMGFADGTYSGIYAFGSALSLLCALGVGILTDRTGRRRNAARLAAGAGVIGPGLVALTGAPWAFAVAHMLIFPISATLFSQLFTLARLAAGTHGPADRDSVLVAVRALFAIPWVVVLPLWSLALDNGVPLLAVYVAGSAAACLTLVVFVLFWPKDGATRWADGGSGLSIRAALAEFAAPPVMVRTALLGAVLSGIMLYNILTGLLITALPGRETGDVALFFGSVAGLEVPFMLALAWPLARLGKTRMILVGGLIYAVFLAALPGIAATPAIWALPLLAALGASVILTVPLQYLQDLLDTRPGAGGSLIALASLGGQMLASVVFAIGTGLAGYALTSWIGAAVVAVGAVGLWALDGRRTRP